MTSVCLYGPTYTKIQHFIFDMKILLASHNNTRSAEFMYNLVLRRGWSQWHALVAFIKCIQFYLAFAAGCLKSRLYPAQVLCLVVVRRVALNWRSRAWCFACPGWKSPPYAGLGKTRIEWELGTIALTEGGKKRECECTRNSTSFVVPEPLHKWNGWSIVLVYVRNRHLHYFTTT